MENLYYELEAIENGYLVIKSEPGIKTTKIFYQSALHALEDIGMIVKENISGQLNNIENMKFNNLLITIKND